MKKLKTADGSPAAAGLMGVADEHIKQHDTVIVPISQFDFSEKDIEDKFGGDSSFMLQDVVNSVQKDMMNIKFDGDTHVSPYRLCLADVHY